MINFGKEETWRAVDGFDPTTLEWVDTSVRVPPASAECLVALGPGGTRYLVQALCPHRGLPLVRFARAGNAPGTLRCSAHGYVFDLESGQCLHPPGGASAVSLASVRLQRQEDGTWAAPSLPPPNKSSPT